MLSMILSALLGILITKITDRCIKQRESRNYTYYFILLFLFLIAILHNSLGKQTNPPKWYLMIVNLTTYFEKNTILQWIFVAACFFAIIIIVPLDNDVLTFSRYSKKIQEFTQDVHDGSTITIAAGDMDFFGGVNINGIDIPKQMDNSKEYQQLLELKDNYSIKLKILCRHGLDNDLINSIVCDTTSPEILFNKYRLMDDLNDSTFQQLLRVGKIYTDFKGSVEIRFYNSDSDDKQFRARFIDRKGIVYRKEKELKKNKILLKKRFPFCEIKTYKEALYSVHMLNEQETAYYNEMFSLKWESCNIQNCKKIISFCKSLYYYVNENLPRFHMALVYGNSYEIARKKEKRKEFPPFGVMYLAAAVRKNRDWKVDIIAVDKDSTSEQLDWRKYDAIGFSIISSYSYDILKRSYRLSKKKLDVVIFAGGYQAEKFPNDVFTDFNANIIFKGEGEVNIQEFCRKYESRNFGEIESIIYRGTDHNIHSTEGPRCVDIDAIDPPARDLLPTEDIVMTDRLAGTDIRMVHMLFSRGCEYNCKYCAANQNKNISQIRYRDKENICIELKELKERYNIEGFSIIDDCFLTKQDKAIEICDYIASQNLGLKWSLAARVDSINDDILKSLNNAGCIEIKFGVETGSDELLKKLNKGVTVARAEQAIIKTHNMGMGVKLFIITGLPFETDETHNQTKEFLEKMYQLKYVNRVSLMRFTPLAGSYIYDHPDEFGINGSILGKSTFKHTKLYRDSFNWWSEKKRLQKCNEWFDDMNKFINDRWKD